MKSFDLEAAKSGAPIVTRDGRNVRFLAHIPEASESFRIAAFVEQSDSPLLYREDGTLDYGGHKSEFDLFMKPQKRTIFVNIFKGNRSGSSSEYAKGDADWYDSEEMAKIEAARFNIRPAYVAVPIEIEE